MPRKVPIRTCYNEPALETKDVASWLQSFDAGSSLRRLRSAANKTVSYTSGNLDTEFILLEPIERNGKTVVRFNSSLSCTQWRANVRVGNNSHGIDHLGIRLFNYPVVARILFIAWIGIFINTNLLYYILETTLLYKWKDQLSIKFNEYCSNTRCIGLCLLF